eukprot:5809372-Amphidinium_carterae.1
MHSEHPHHSRWKPPIRNIPPGSTPDYMGHVTVHIQQRATCLDYKYWLKHAIIPILSQREGLAPTLMSLGVPQAGLEEIEERLQC